MKEINTKLGKEINTITMVEIVWSVMEFFLSAAQIPNKIPMGTEKSTEIIFNLIEYPIRDIIITDAATLG